MPERLDDAAAPEGPPESEGDLVNADGSTTRTSSHDGHLDAADVERSPFVEGTDPLSDDAIDRRRAQSASVTPQLVVFGLLALFFTYFFISDLVNRAWGKAALGALVLAICGVAIAREVRQKR